MQTCGPLGHALFGACAVHMHLLREAWHPTSFLFFSQVFCTTSVHLSVQQASPNFMQFSFFVFWSFFLLVYPLLVYVCSGACWACIANVTVHVFMAIFLSMSLGVMEQSLL